MSQWNQRDKYIAYSRLFRTPQEGEARFSSWNEISHYNEQLWRNIADDAARVFQGEAWSAHDCHQRFLLMFNEYNRLRLLPRNERLKQHLTAYHAFRECEWTINDFRSKYKGE